MKERCFELHIENKSINIFTNPLVTCWHLYDFAQLDIQSLNSCASHMQ